LISKRAFFLSAYTYPLQPEAVLVWHGVLPNLQTSKRKLASNIFAGNLLPPSWVTCTRVQGPQVWGRWVALAYFKYTPVKAKIKIITNTFCDLFWGCHQSQQFLFPYFPFHITTCFGLYRPSSGEIYTVIFKSYYTYNG
jgi:hypothetical protein